MTNTGLLEYQINSIVSLTNEEWKELLPFLETVTLRKNEYFLREGQVCESIAFVNSGVLIYFKFLESGREITTDFTFQKEWVTDNQKRLNRV